MSRALRIGDALLILTVGLVAASFPLVWLRYAPHYPAPGLLPVDRLGSTEYADSRLFDAALGLIAGAVVARVAGYPLGAARFAFLGGFILAYGVLLLEITPRHDTISTVTALHPGTAVGAAAGIAGMLAARAYAELLSPDPRDAG